VRKGGEISILSGRGKGGNVHLLFFVLFSSFITKSLYVIPKPQAREMPETFRCKDVELECNSTNALTILNTDYIPTNLLPFHISTDEGEIHFQEPFVICARLGIRIDLWKAVTPFLKPTNEPVHSLHPVVNRIRFDHLESCWFPFLEQHLSFSAESDIITVNGGQIRKSSPASHLADSVVECIDIPMSRTQFEYVFLSKCKNYSPPKQPKTLWLECKTDNECDAKENTTMTVPFTVSNRQILKNMRRTISREDWFRQTIDVKRRAKTVTHTLIDPDEVKIVTFHLSVDRLLLIGLDGSSSTSQFDVYYFFNVYGKELSESFPRDDFLHMIHVLPGRCRSKVMKCLDRHGDHLQLCEWKAVQTEECEKTLSDIGHVLLNEQFSWIEPLVMSNSRRQSSAKKGFHQHVLDAWKQPQKPYDFNVIDSANWLSMLVLLRNESQPKSKKRVRDLLS